MKGHRSAKGPASSGYVGLKGSRRQQIPNQGIQHHHYSTTSGPVHGSRAPPLVFLSHHGQEEAPFIQSSTAKSKQPQPQGRCRPRASRTESPCSRTMCKRIRSGQALAAIDRRAQCIAKLDRLRPRLHHIVPKAINTSSAPVASIRARRRARAPPSSPSMPTTPL
jgi:hypothetical protein